MNNSRINKNKNKFKKKKLIYLFILIILLILGFSCRTAFHKSHIRNNDQRKHITLVAVGDSLTQGVGDQSNNGGYVGQIKQQIQAKDKINVTTYNYGKSGDRSDQILARLNKSRTFQKRVKQANVITMTVGGNDLLQGLQKYSSVNFNSNENSHQLDNSIHNVEDIYSHKLIKLINSIRKLNPNAPIFLFSIYNPVYVYFANVTELNKYIDQFNVVTKNTIHSYKRIYFMNINQKLSYGQYNTVNKRKKLIKKDNSINTSKYKNAEDIEKKLLKGTSQELNIYLSSADHFHPNYKGYTQMTNLLYKTMQKHSLWKYRH